MRNSPSPDAFYGVCTQPSIIKHAMLHTILKLPLTNAITHELKNNTPPKQMHLSMNVHSQAHNGTTNSSTQNAHLSIMNKKKMNKLAMRHDFQTQSR